MSSKHHAGVGLPITLIVTGVIFFCMSWRADSAGREVVYWNRGAALTPPALYFAAGGFIVVGLLLLIHRRGHQ
jgi:hypothetical protein